MVTGSPSGKVYLAPGGGSSLISTGGKTFAGCRCRLLGSSRWLAQRQGVLVTTSCMCAGVHVDGQLKSVGGITGKHCMSSQSKIAFCVERFTCVTGCHACYADRCCSDH